MYDSGLIPGKKASLKTIIVGNIAVGGTGKTPHVVWLAQELAKTKRVAILSRGYKRKTRGFRWVNSNDDPSLAGDEPLEIKSLLPNIPVAVDSDRLRGVDRIKKELDYEPDFVILDDGFQHRSLIPHYSIILSHAEKPYYSDYLMPAGRLREATSSVKRADSLIITNTTAGNHQEGKDILSLYKLGKGQNLFTSSFIYSDLMPLNEKAMNIRPEEADSLMLVTGIAQPDSLIKQWESRIPLVIMSYSDHHIYSEEEINFIVSRFEEMTGSNKILITTGKDAVKLKLFPQICDIALFCQNRQLIIDEEDKKQLLESIENHG